MSTHTDQLAWQFYLDLALNGLQARLAGAEALPNTSNFSETVRGLLDDIRQDARSRIGLVPREKGRLKQTRIVTATNETCSTTCKVCSAQNYWE